MKTPITLTTWNILNPAYEKPGYYGEIAHKYLKWDTGRKEALHAYIKTLKSDIYCFQESTNKIAEELTTVIKNNNNRNYDYIWTKRKFDADDGCAIIYDKDVVNLLNVIICRHNNTHIIQSALFENVTNKNKFWCFNTHVNFMTRNQDIMAMLKTTKQNPFDDKPKIIVGDFNAEVSEEWYKKLDEELYVDSWVKKNGLHPQSDFTYNSGGKNSKVIDFILLSGFDFGNVEKVYIEGDTTKITYLPNDQIPSDHMPQTIIFKI